MKIILRLSALATAICIACTMLTGCSMDDKKEETRTIIDITGAEVEIPTEVDEVVNLFPFGCQMMIGLGLDEYLVGISEDTFETKWLEVMCPEAKNIPTYPSYEISAEELLAINPDVVFCSDEEQAKELRSKGITAITFMYLTIDDFKYTINLMGEVLGGSAQEKCTAYIGYLDDRIDDVSTLRNSVTEKENLYYINGANDRGFYKTAGADSTMEACTELCYIDLVTSPLIKFPETKVDAEALLATNPQNIIIGGRYQHILYDEIYQADEWSHISAIQNKNVFTIPIGISAWNRYSLETALLIPWTASMVYPEYFEFDAVNETIEFYKTFMGYELTEEQVEYMIAGLTPNGKKEIASR